MAFASGAEEGVLPVGLQVQLLLKVLPYDRGFKDRAEDGITIAVVFAPRSDASREAKDTFMRAAGDSPRQIAGKHIEFITIPEELLGKLEVLPDAALVCEGVDYKKAAVILTGKKVLTVGVQTDAARAGLQLAMVPRNGRPKVVVNLEAVAAAGIQLDARLLPLAEIVEPRRKALANP